MNPLYVSDNAIESCIRENCENCEDCEDFEGNDEIICEFPFGLDTTEEKARAAFIVKAANAHGDLVAALQNFVKCEKFPSGLTTAWDIAREALAKAGEA